MTLSEIAADLLSPSPYIAQFESEEDMPACGRISTARVAKGVQRERYRLHQLAIALLDIRDRTDQQAR